MNARPMALLHALAVATVFLAADLAYTQAPKPDAAASALVATDGEVRKVDVDAQKITLRHEPITNLDMPSMTMVFRASDPAMLQKVKVGDKVRFKADKVGGQITVVELEIVK